MTTDEPMLLQVELTARDKLLRYLNEERADLLAEAKSHWDYDGTSGTYDNVNFAHVKKEEVERIIRWVKRNIK